MMANGLSEKDFAASIPRAKRDFQLISREKRMLSIHFGETF